MIYDHISFHTDERPNLQAEYAVRHIGYYYAWAVSQNLHSQAVAALPQLADLQQGRISGCRFVLQYLNGGIDEYCFNETGNRFTRYYYEDEEDGYGHFIRDYFTVLDLANEEAFYRVDYLARFQKMLDGVFQAAFEQWQQSLKVSF